MRHTKAILIVAPVGAGSVIAARAWSNPLPWNETTRLEASLVHQAARLLDPELGALLADRPFRAPHHSVSLAGLVGGGDKPRPGEVSLAHGGTLLLDEADEFRRDALESLFAALVAGKSELRRYGEIWTYPAAPALVIGTVDPRNTTPERLAKLTARFADLQYKLSVRDGGKCTTPYSGAF